jgi:glycosyltransferase involved in cell wall biosynthesis
MKIAVITPSLPERAQLLEECKASVINQTRPADLHLVSVDKNRVGLVTMRNNMVASLPLEYDWLAFLDDDDIFLPRHLEILAAVAEETQADIIYPDCDVEGFVKNFQPRRFDHSALLQDNYIPVTVLMRRSLFDNLGGFRHTGFVEDWDLWKRAAEQKAKFVFAPATTWVYRRQPDGLVNKIYEKKVRAGGPLRVSIFTPTNNTRWLPDLYKSIKDQSFHEWVILYNNGAHPLAMFSSDPRVKQIEVDIDKDWIGPLKGQACDRCTGDILLEIDHDDMLMPNAIEEVVKAFSDPQVGFVYSNTVHLGHDVEKGVKGKVARFDECFGWQYREVKFEDLVLDEHISFAPTPDSISRIWYAPNHLRAFRKSVYNMVGGYSKEMRVLDDLDLMCRMYMVTRFQHIDKGLYVYRIHGGNTWQKPDVNSEIQNNVYRIYDMYIESLVERWADLEGLRKIELGGRMAAKPGYETADLLDADIITNLNDPWPFPDSSVGVFRSFDVFEHLIDPKFTMKELSRCLAPGGWVICQVPSTDGRGAFQDPTHVSFWNENSFHYYTKAAKAKYIAPYFKTPVRFQAPRLYTTEKNFEQVCWVTAHLINLKHGYRPSGLIEI